MREFDLDKLYFVDSESQSFRKDARKFPKEVETLDEEDPIGWLSRLAQENAHTLETLYLTECAVKKRVRDVVKKFIYPDPLPEDFLAVLASRQKIVDVKQFLKPVPIVRVSKKLIGSIRQLFPFIPTSYRLTASESVLFLNFPRFCPKCLEEDKTPYFRKQWRLPFNFICQKHNTLLYWTCPNQECKKPLLFWKSRKITECYSCKKDLRKTDLLKVNSLLGKNGTTFQDILINLFYDTNNAQKAVLDLYWSLRTVFYYKTGKKEITEGLDTKNSLLVLDEACERIKNNEPLIACLSCQKSFTSPTGFANHSCKPLVCSKCKKTFHHKTSYEKHVEYCDQEKECSFCGKQDFTSDTSYQDHLWMCKEKRTCPSCDETEFSSKAAYLGHIRVCGKNLMCSNCDKSDFGSKLSYDDHIKACGKLLCSECGTDFIYESSYQKHIKNCKGKQIYGKYKGNKGLERAIRDLREYKLQTNRCPRRRDMEGISSAIQRGEWSPKINTWKDISSRAFGYRKRTYRLYRGKKGLKRAITVLKTQKRRRNRLPSMNDKEMRIIVYAIQKGEFEKFGIEKWNDLMLEAFGRKNRDRGHIGAYHGKKGLDRAIKELREFYGHNNRYPRKRDPKMGSIYSAIYKECWKKFGIEKWSDLIFRAFGKKVWSG